jgi:glycosyltransferase involved in cell wall biosynthesis
MLRNMKLHLPSYKIIEQDNLGRAAVRNRGAKESSGELLIFLDDDMTVPTHWLQAHCDHHEKYAKSITSGRLVSPPISSTNDFHIYRTWLGDKWNQDIEKSTTKQGLIKFAYLTANNFSIEKSDFIKIGGFDSRLRDLEDYDLALRAKQLSYDIYVIEDAYACNTDTGVASCLDYIKRIKSYHLTKKTLISLKSHIFMDSNLGQDNAPNLLKKIIYWLLAHYFWIKIIDKGWLTWVPKFIRYKLYDAIIYANGVLFSEKVSIK